MAYPFVREDDVTVFRTSDEITLSPGEYADFTYEVPKGYIFYLMWTEEQFNDYTFYEWYFDNELVDDGWDVHQSVGDHRPLYYPPEEIREKVTIRIYNLDTVSHTYYVRFVGYLRKIVR